MRKPVSFCPYCGVEFERTGDSPDARRAPARQCENCNEVLEITVNQFPLA